MTILLKNLTARTPDARDFAALTGLMDACEKAENRAGGGELADQLSEWRRLDFHLASDAWVIVTNKGQLVGFACLWHQEHAGLTTFLCVHPEYRQRGIGTLLLRMIEVRAREHMHQADSRQRVVLQGLLSSANTGARRLFEREGYQVGRPFLRISFTLHAEHTRQDQPETSHLYTIDLGLEQQGQLLSASAPGEQEVLYHVQLYQTYEKELRAATCNAPTAPAALQTVGA